MRESPPVGEVSLKGRTTPVTSVVSIVAKCGQCDRVGSGNVQTHECRRWLKVVEDRKAVDHVEVAINHMKSISFPVNYQIAIEDGNDRMKWRR